MKAQIVCWAGAALELTFPLGDESRIGRDPGNEVSVPFEGVSRVHAKISHTSGSFWVEDAGSMNGTWVNGRRIQKERLNHLDVITLGARVELVFLDRVPASVSGVQRQGIVSARLVTIGGAEAGAIREIPRGILTVGRATACNLVIDSAAVSKMHARIERASGLITLTDLGSANGSFRNGVRVNAATLSQGDRIVFATVREFRVDLEYGLVAGEGTPVPFHQGVAGNQAATRAEYLDVGTGWKMRYDFSPGENRETPEGPAASARSPKAAAPAAAEMPLITPAVSVRPVKPPPAEPAKSTAAPSPKQASPAAVPAVPSGVVARTADVPSAAAVPSVATPPVVPPELVAPVAPDVPGPPAVAPSAPATPPPPPPASGSVSRSSVRRSTGFTLALVGEQGTFRLGRGVHIVGRLESCAVAILDKRISRQHASLEVTEAGATVADLESANGTFLNGQQIDTTRPLAGGDSLAFGEIPFKVSFPER